MKDRIVITLVFLLLLGCRILPIDSPSKWGGGKVVDGKDCSWYVNQKKRRYCAYDDHKGDPSNLQYKECDSCESYIRKVFSDVNPK